MEQSSEVRDAVTRFYDRLGAGDVEGTDATIDAEGEAFVIGTQRIGGGREPWMDSVRENAEMGIKFEAGNIRAFAEGEMGWAVDEPSVVLPDGTRLAMRMTAVLRRDSDGTFRNLHHHYSWAVPDDVAMSEVAGWREQLRLGA